MARDDRRDFQASDIDNRNPFAARTEATEQSDESLIQFTIPHDERGAATYGLDRNDLTAAEHTRLLNDRHVDAGEPQGDAQTAVHHSAEESYWRLSRAPLESMVFTLPLVLIYECGVLVLGRGTPRNGADVWLRGILDTLGFDAYFFLLPALTIVGLAAWHHLEHDRWRFRGRVLVGMAFESLLLACVLIGLARLQEGVWPDVLQPPAAWTSLDTTDSSFAPSSVLLQRLVGYCGAGLYEEVLFRLLMVPVLTWGLIRLCGVSRLAAAGAAVICSALLFSAAHYVGVHGDVFDLYSFTFRTVAGVFFGVLFWVRGFGISAGTHAVYDVLVGLV